ncbi:hypothetical protein HZB89_02145, partial [archaeon]|nr:hypothetical protein [archaeon]
MLLGYIDLIVAGLFFLMAISLVFIGMQQFLPEQKSISAGLYGTALLQLTENVTQKTYLIESDCNSSIYDCGYFYPTQFTVETDANILSGNPFYLDGNKVWVIALASNAFDLFFLDHNRIIPDYNTQALDLNYWNDGNNYFFKNRFFDANLTDRNAVIDFTAGSGIEASVYFPRDQNFNVDFNSQITSRASRPDGFKAQVFSKAGEAWVFMPADANITIDSNNAMFLADSDANGLIAGFIRMNEWWNNDWTYRMPLSFNSKNVSGTDLNAVIDINFEGFLLDVNDTNSVYLSSVAFVEYLDGLCDDFNADEGCTQNPAEIVSSTDANKTARFMLLLDGFTGQQGVRNFEVYFDTNSRPKDANHQTGLLDAVDLNYSFGNAETQATRVKDFNATNLLVHNPASMQVELWKQSE